MRRSHITFSRLTVQGGVWIENDWQTLLKGITCIFCCVLILFIFLTWGHFQSPPVTSCFNFSKKPQKDQMSEKGSWRMRLKVMRNKALNHSSSVNILCPSHINRFSSTMVVVLLWRQQLLWSYVTFIPCFVMIDGSIVEEITYSIYMLNLDFTSYQLSDVTQQWQHPWEGSRVYLYFICKRLWMKCSDMFTSNKVLQNKLYNGACSLVFPPLFGLWCTETALLRIQLCVHLPKRHHFVTVRQVLCSLLATFRLEVWSFG